MKKKREWTNEDQKEQDYRDMVWIPTENPFKQEPNDVGQYE